MALTGWATKSKGRGVMPFDYAEEPAVLPAWAEWDVVELGSDGQALRPQEHIQGEPPTVNAGLEALLADATQRGFDAGRERGREEGRAAQSEAQRATRAEESRQRTDELCRMMESFTAERDAFLRRAEQEVVRLALAVAARILRREAQSDPLLLLGAVRVALGQIASATEATLHVPREHADLWREAVALLPNRTLKPRVIGEDSMRLGDCTLETDLGSVDLAARTQLNELEASFFQHTVGAAVEAAAE